MTTDQTTDPPIKQPPYIKQHTCFTVSCSECKDAYDAGNGVIMHYDSPGEAIDAAQESDWFTLADGRFVCWSCIDRMVKAGELEQDDSDDADGPAYRIVARAEASA